MANDFENYKRKKAQIIAGQRNLPCSIIRKYLRPLFRVCLWLQRKIKGFSVEILSGMEFPKERPLIFAVTHIGKWDFEIVNEQIGEQFFIIAADYIHMHGNVNGFFMNVNGVIYVDEQSRQDRANTKRLMTKLLLTGRNIMIFPEGTWNLSENEIVRDIAYGTAEAAITANAVIIPIAVEQYGKRFVICSGEVLEPAKIIADKTVLTCFLRNELAGLKWRIWEREGLFQRETFSPPDTGRILFVRGVPNGTAIL